MTEESPLLVVPCILASSVARYDVRDITSIVGAGGKALDMVVNSPRYCLCSWGAVFDHTRVMMYAQLVNDGVFSGGVLESA